MHFKHAIRKMNIILSLVIIFLEEIKNVILKEFIQNVSQNSIATFSCSFHKHMTFKISNLKMFRTLEYNFSSMLIFISNCLYILTLTIIIHSRISSQCNNFLRYYTNIFAIRINLSSAAGFYDPWNLIKPPQFMCFSSIICALRPTLTVN
jgi:hypothetical protein